MAQRVAAIFRSREAAERAADALVDLGANHGHISMLARGEADSFTTPAAEGQGDDFIEPAREVGDSGAPLTTADDGDAAQGAATGAVIGAGVGVAAGIMALMVPGIGPVLAAGPLAWALGGALGSTAAGAVAGGIYGGLRDIGIEERHAYGYEERIRGGDVLLTAAIPSTISEERVLDVFAEHGAEDVSFAEDAGTLTGTPAYADTQATTLPSAAGSRPTTATGYDTNVARGQEKQIEGEMRDRAADATLNPMDDLAAKTQKAAGKIQEDYGKAIEPRDSLDEERNAEAARDPNRGRNI